MNQLTTTSGSFDFSPQSLEQAFDLCERLAQSSMVPKDYQRNPGNILVAIQWGAEVGLKPLQAMQNIAVINGRPSLWGDAMLALVRSSSVCEYVTEDEDGSVSYCRVKRRGEPEQVRTFSDDDARAAGLKGKQGPWTQYPRRMRQMRARAFALRDVFPDVLKGLAVAEEVMDIPRAEEVGGAPVRNASPAQIAQAAITTSVASDALPEGRLDAILEQLKTTAATQGTAALGNAWKTLTKQERAAVGAESLKTLQGYAKECDELLVIAAEHEAREAAQGDNDE